MVPDGTPTGGLSAEMRSELWDVEVPVDIVVTTPAQVARYGSLVGTALRPALREGRTIHAAS